MLPTLPTRTRRRQLCVMWIVQPLWHLTSRNDNVSRAVALHELRPSHLLNPKRSGPKPTKTTSVSTKQQSRLRCSLSLMSISSCRRTPPCRLAADDPGSTQGRRRRFQRTTGPDPSTSQACCQADHATTGTFQFGPKPQARRCRRQSSRQRHSRCPWPRCRRPQP